MKIHSTCRAAAVLLALGGSLLSYSASGQVMSRGGSPTPPDNSKLGSNPSPLTVDNTAAVRDSKESSEYKSFVSIPADQSAKKIKSGESFLKKYPDSQLRPQVYSQLTVLYIQAGDPDRGLAAGSSAIQLNPKDMRTMGILSQTMARSVTPTTPDAAQRLDQAEKYGKEALAVASTLTKPEGVADDVFSNAKNEALAMAHSGLGLVDVQRGKFAEAIPDLQQAAQLDTGKDPTNFYLLGVANQNSGHYADAATAFAQCAQASGNLQATCKSGSDEAKKRASAASPK
jgi:tetratricopeptide (TPR) repeat protein